MILIWAYTRRADPPLGLRRRPRVVESKVSKAALGLKLAPDNGGKTVYNLPVGMRRVPVRGCRFIKFENGSSCLHLPGSQWPASEQVDVTRAGRPPWNWRKRFSWLAHSRGGSAQCWGDSFCVYSALGTLWAALQILIITANTDCARAHY